MANAAAGELPVARPRFWFLDNLKVLLTVLVILHHVGQAYGPTGGFWYISNPDRWPYLGFFFWFNASFFMGLFFFISAYFMPGSYDRKGAGAFLKDRVPRFLVPLLIFALLIHPVMSYVSYIGWRGGNGGFFDYVAQIYFGLGPKPAGWASHWPDFNFGHLWFIEHLLVYALVYAGWRKWTGRPAPVPRQDAAPGDLALFIYAVLLAGASGLIRFPYGVDHWVAFLGFIQMEPAHIPQYLSLFVFGTMAHRRGWLTTMPAARGYRWLGIGLAFAAVTFSLRFFAGLSYDQMDVWVTFAESFLCVGMVVGLPVLFRERWNCVTPRWQRWGENAFAAYLVHFPLVMASQYAVSFIPSGAALRFLMAGVLSVVASFSLAHWLRQIHGARAFL